MTPAGMQVRGQFITLEGIEGVGKSTNLQLVAGILRDAGKPVLVTREPGGVPCAERIREILLAPDLPPIPAMTELLLMFSARAAHLSELIQPTLAAGTWVVCDRFTDASYAYQGGGRGVPESTIAKLEEVVQAGFRPDLTLLLDADWEATRHRRASRGTTDRFETEGAAFFARVRDAYVARARSEPRRVQVIDAAQPLKDVQTQIRLALETFLNVGSYK